jgi:hypothetical protein
VNNKPINCPSEIADDVLRILETTLIRIRGFGYAGKGEQCAVEAHHVHNIPRLLGDYRLERLEFYLNVERTGYLSASSDVEPYFEVIWKRLEDAVTRYRTSSDHKP